jgi:flagellar basal body-associated protein FliL
MSDSAAEAAAVETVTGAGTGSGRSLFGWKAIVLLAVVLAAAAGGAGYYFLVLRAPVHNEQAAPKEPPLPFYLEVKPFVVSMSGNDGATHFVQIGVNLTLSGTSLGNLVTAMLPEVEDTLRLTALSFKVNDITTPEGVDKMRARMTADLNRMLLQRLGAARIVGRNDGRKEVVQNIYFSQLIVE